MTRKADTYALTDAHLAKFRATVLATVRDLGLTGWAWHVELFDGPTKNREMAWVSAEFQARAVTVLLNRHWGTPITDLELRRTAIHEVCHVLLSELVAMASQRHRPHTDAVDEGVHTVIARLETLLAGGIE